MSSAIVGKLKLVLKVLGFIFISLPLNYGNNIDIKVLNVGEELFKENMPLQMGYCLYRLQGLKPHTWYEVKISYPASIPAVFTIQLNKGNSDLGLSMHRKLLNTEKLIFMTESSNAISHQVGMHVLVTVEPEGVVAIPGVKERELIMFNIVCDELIMGMPHAAWAVVVLAMFCLALAFIVPLFLPSYILPVKDKQLQSTAATVRDADKSS